ncbi:type II toxin-antitoxin system RelE family toxin [Haloferula sargassicola]|uniref:mRNA interferase HigB n=1 Tax=Haloferula sargassicola TaxID=490096 RepID=A0ABP9UHH4_9BACT
MKHLTTPRFWQAYDRLPEKVRTIADANFELLKNDPYHPSLHFKKVGRFWSVHAGIKYRALAVQEDDAIVWFWIGSHADYDKLLS